MPTYEYECLKCGHSFETFQGMTDDPVKRCPKCKCKVRRLIGRGAGVLFKGSGFYQTDYRSDSYRKEVTKETSAEAPSGATESKAKKEKDTATAVKTK